MQELCKNLTSRQKEILSLLRRGFTNAEICRSLNISANTVKVHLANIYKILGVSNRTEAASVELEKLDNKVVNDDEVRIAFVDCESLEEFSPAQTLVLSIVESLNRYGIFSIKGNEDPSSPSTYRIKISGTLNKENSFFVTLFRGTDSEVLWSESQQVNPADDFQLIGSQIAIQLFRRMLFSAAQTYEAERDASPRWWYASCFANVKMDGVSRESFERVSSELEALTNHEKFNLYAACSLMWAYYAAINESWVNAKVYVAKMENLACAGMRNDPYSISAQFMMAIYNIVIGNKNEAISYLLQIVEKNPLHLRARRMLAQLYMLVGKADEALNLLNDSARFISESESIQFHSTPRAFIYFLQDKLAECEEISRQVLMFHPETPIARLLVIACNNRKGNFEESKKHIQKLFEYHPHFQKSDVDRLLNGIPSPKKEAIFASVSNVFQQK